MQLIPVPLGVVQQAQRIVQDDAHASGCTVVDAVAGVEYVFIAQPYPRQPGASVAVEYRRRRQLATTLAAPLGGPWECDGVMLDPRGCVALDFETTGRDPRRDRVVQVGVVEFADLPRGEVVGRWSQLVDPQRQIDPAATAVHGIGDAAVVGAPTMRAVLPDLMARLAGRYVITFNGLDYDLPLLQAECDRVGVAFDARAFAPVDVYPFVPAAQGWKGKRLLAQAARYGIPIDAHDASSDAEAAVWLLLCLAMRGHAPATLPECYAAQADLWRDLLRPRQAALFAMEDP